MDGYVLEDQTMPACVVGSYSIAKAKAGALDPRKLVRPFPEHPSRMTETAIRNELDYYYQGTEHPHWIEGRIPWNARAEALERELRRFGPGMPGRYTWCDWCERDRPAYQVVEAVPMDPEDGRMICNSCADADARQKGIDGEENLEEDPPPSTHYIEGAGWVNEIGERL